MRSLTLVLLVGWLIGLLGIASLAYAETKCSEVRLDSQKLDQKLQDLSLQFLKLKTLSAKKEKVTQLLETVNCELDRTSNLPLDHEYRWNLSETHSLLADLATVSTKNLKDCKTLEEKMTFHESNQGTASDEALVTKNLELAKKLAKNFCQLSK